MALSRYKFVSKVENDLEEIEDLLAARRKNYIVQHKTRIMRTPDPRVVASLYNAFHLWKQADRFWKLADQYYNDSRYWWIIAEYNQKPTEAMIQNGEIIVIPQPLSAALAALGY